MKTRLFILIGLLAFFASCEKEEALPVDTFPATLNFSDLKPGQKARYVHFTSACGDIADKFEFTGDTLLVEVVEIGDTLYFKESLTSNSPMLIQGIHPEFIQHPVEGDAEKILIKERFNSPLYFFYANDTIQLKPEYDISLTQNDCVLVSESGPFVGNDIAIANSFKIGPVEQRNKTVISCEPFDELDAYLFYDAQKLYMSYVVRTEWTVEESLISGWVIKE